MKYSVSTHGRMRANQRLNTNSKKEVNKAFTDAIKSGLSAKDFDGPFNLFLHSKIRQGSKIKVHSGMMFIYRGKRMITCYKVPHRYINLALDVKEEKRLLKSYLGGDKKKNKQLSNQIIKGVRNVAYYVFRANRYKVIADKVSFDILHDYILKCDVSLKALYKRLYNEDLFPKELYFYDCDLIGLMYKNIAKFEYLTYFVPEFGHKVKPEDINPMNEEELKKCIVILYSCLNCVKLCDYFIDVYKGSDNNVKRFESVEVTKQNDNRR